ncbi:MAG: protein kinase [Myxococcaceae bacterium]
MNRNSIFVALVFFISISAPAQNLKMGPPTFFPEAWGAGREMLKKISQGVFNRQKIQEEAQKRDFSIAGLFGHKKSHSETMVERRQRIKSVRQELIEASRDLRSVGAKSSQELESELFSLLAMGSLPEEERNNPLSIEIQEAERPLLLQKSAQSESWQVPGMLVAPGGSGSGPGSGSQSAPALKNQDLVDSCHDCKKSFGITRWKNHCLACGEVMCSKCLVGKIPVPGYSEVQEACQTCVTQHQTRQKVKPEAQRIEELCSQFSTQAEQSTSTRDNVLTAADKALGALGSLVPPPFDSVISAAQKVISLAQTAATNTAESQRLAARVARLNMAMMKLATQGDTALAQRAATDLKKTFDGAIKLLQKFQPDSSRTFMERVKATWTQYASSTVDKFNEIHTELTIIMNDRAFALSLEDRNRLTAPTIDEIKEGVRQELDHVVSEVKRVGEETGNRLGQLEDSLQQLLDKTYGGAGHRQVVLLDPSVVKIDRSVILGSGAFGVVYGGTLYGSTPVAFKELEHCSGNIAETLQKEVEQMMKVSHPNVVKVYGLLCGKDPKTPSGIVMERLGHSLEEVVHRGLSPEQKMKYTQDIMAGMGRVHEGRLVHCDLKPQNILITENRHTAKIIDFGISQGKSTIIFSNAARSRGTVQYMAPEVLSGQRLGLSCDVYSFGVLLYELWSGQKAWDTYSEDQIHNNVLRGVRPTTLEQMQTEAVPDPIAALIDACWKQKPGERPTFNDMQAILRIEDFWETSPTRWPSFLQSPTAHASPFTPVGGLRPGLPSAQEFERYGCDALCQALQTQEIHDDILDWLRNKKYNGRQFVQSGAKMIEQLRSGQKVDELHIEDFELLQKKIFAQAQEETERAQVRAEATKKAQLDAEKRAAERRVVAALEAQQAFIQREVDQRAPIQSEEARLRQELQQGRTTVGLEIAKRLQTAAQKAEEAKKVEEAKQKARQEAERVEVARKAEETRRAEEARLAAASRPAANVARTTAMTADPLERAGDWYKGPRESKSVTALEWELGRKGSKEMTFKDAQAYAASRAADGWRLPTIWELDALYQQKGVLGADLETGGYFWSDTAVVGYDDYHWRLYFGDGNVYYGFGNFNCRVRLVRGGTG